MYEQYFPKKRYDKTLAFIKKHIPTSAQVLDLGVSNPFSALLIKEGYSVKNTLGEDLDEDRSALHNNDYTVVTALEIAEHLLNPYTLFKEIQADKIVVSVPLKLWFSPAYQSKTDMRDRHYHEFEAWQLDWLLEKTGWKIIDSQKWTNPVNKIGFRPLLRKFTPRYYIVYAEKQH